MKVVKSLGLSEGLWERIEEVRGVEKRSPFVERLLWGALEVPAEAPAESERDAQKRDARFLREGLAPLTADPEARKGVERVADRLEGVMQLESEPHDPAFSAFKEACRREVEGREGMEGLRNIAGNMGTGGTAVHSMPAVSEPTIYMCPVERCFQTASGPGVCPSHRTRRMVKVGSRA